MILCSANGEVTLKYAPPKCVAELRIQNTMSGKIETVLVETDESGFTHVPATDFGQHSNTYVRILTEDQEEHVLHFINDPSKSVDGAMVFVASLPPKPPQQEHEAAEHGEHPKGEE